MKIWPGHTTYKERMDVMRTMIPAPFKHPGKALYVGAHGGRFEASNEIFQSGNEITVLEIWPHAIEELKAVPRFAKRITHYVLGDVRQVDRVDLPHDTFDYVFWLHGPEHVLWREGLDTIPKLEALAMHTVILSCPWGYTAHGFRENPHNKHVSYWLPDDFARLGYKTACLGPKWTHGGQLLAWREVE